VDAVILSIGSEVVTGQVADTNAQWAAQELLRAGIEVTRFAAVDDLPGPIAEAVNTAAAPDRVVWMTGGLGPTRDDISVDSVARALDLPVIEDPQVRERIRAWYASRNRPLTEGGIRQARVPRGAETFPNPVGSAPGIMLERSGCIFVMLPGVPAEMKALALEHILPRLASRGRPTASRIYRMAGVPEGGVDERLRGLWESLSDGTRFALQIGQGEVILRVRVTGGTGEECRTRLDVLDLSIRRILGDDLYGTDSDTLEGEVIRLLGDRGLDLATAESVTGGIIGALPGGVGRVP
jgi:nicotinamide-nucleotide amidase